MKNSNILEESEFTTFKLFANQTDFYTKIKGKNKAIRAFENLRRKVLKKVGRINQYEFFIQLTDKTWSKFFVN